MGGPCVWPPASMWVGGWDATWMPAAARLPARRVVLPPVAAAPLTGSPQPCSSPHCTAAAGRHDAHAHVHATGANFPKNNRRAPPPPAPGPACVQAGSLGDLLLRQSGSPHVALYGDEDAARWALQVAEALEHLHLLAPAVVHRDVKSNNVMLARGPDGLLHAKLGDFGLHVVSMAARRWGGDCRGPGGWPGEFGGHLRDVGAWASLHMLTGVLQGRGRIGEAARGHDARTADELPRVRSVDHSVHAASCTIPAAPLGV